MSNYTQTTFFAPKDLLLSGNPAKLIKGADVDPELANIATAIATKYDSTSIVGVTVPFGSGSVGAPSITFSADLTTGFYRNAAQTIGVAANGALVATIAQTAVTLQSGVSLTVGGALTVSTGGSSLKGGVSITAPASGTSLTVAGFGTASAAVINSGSSAGTSAGDLVVNRAGSTVNTVVAGPNLLLSDTTNSTDSALQNSGGQTELWQFNGGTWRQIAKFLASSVTGGQQFQILDDGGAMQAVGWRGTPQNVQSTNYTLQLSDRGKSILYTTGSGSTVTIPHGVFSAGDVVTVVSFLNTGTLTLASDGTMAVYWGNGTVTNASRTLTNVAIATIYFESATNCVVSGAVS